MIISALSTIRFYPWCYLPFFICRSHLAGSSSHHTTRYVLLFKNHYQPKLTLCRAFAKQSFLVATIWNSFFHVKENHKFRKTVQGARKEYTKREGSNEANSTQWWRSHGTFQLTICTEPREKEKRKRSFFVPSLRQQQSFDLVVIYTYRGTRSTVLQYSSKSNIKKRKNLLNGGVWIGVFAGVILVVALCQR
jgi:hypothetical protein